MQQGLQLQKTVDRLPEILEKNAVTMMRRMITRMKTAMEQHAQAGNVSHGALFLKVGENDLVREFERAIKEATSTAALGSADSAVAGLSLEAADGPDAVDEFETSTALFDRLCANARAVGVKGTGLYHKEVFVGALKDAFEQSRMDRQAMQELRPYARAALNAELLVLYGKLDELANQPA
jgi:hypothetical protein